ncbi:MAG: zinc finger domain-containing protein [Candidatus Bathyarchaeia archaeon]
MVLKCTSCNTNVLAKDNFVKFFCPNCGEELIVRCSTCKALGNTYKCKKCGFEGP